MLDQLLSRIKNDRQRDIDQLVRFTSKRVKCSELRNGSWVDISEEVMEDLRRTIAEADAILNRIAVPEHWPAA